MASPNAPFLSNGTVSIINPQYCASSQMDLAVARKVKILSFGNFFVIDINDNIIFKVEGAFLSFHARRVLLDPAGNPIVTLQNKKMSAHHRWEAYRGDGTDSSNLLFSAKRPSMFQFKRELDVFLARNTEQNVCDFKVKGSWLKRSCVIYAGESSPL
ncbi:hypothetical protein FEM48_Zijuj11G0119900 [Ziziphus jujuba var. spinosa]|uniref:Protein LURP-one-related 15-like n=1 Tax=Ziziphus jujuba var. spinosa TaxID=714518 RepID=A0A978UIT3_ZIZJJ|nr:hypothetical protein FEM48_Zijuj11G0119900 [Ziziphus jujuba var. spinosa]